MEGDMICYTDGIRSQELLNVHDMNLIGAHNYENVMAAVCITKAAGIPDEIIVEQIKQFKAVEHRIEFVTEKTACAITMIPREPTRRRQSRRLKR